MITKTISDAFKKTVNMFVGFILFMLYAFTFPFAVACFGAIYNPTGITAIVIVILTMFCIGMELNMMPAFVKWHQKIVVFKGY